MVYRNSGSLIIEIDNTSVPEKGRNGGSVASRKAEIYRGIVVQETSGTVAKEDDNRDLNNAKLHTCISQMV